MCGMNEDVVLDRGLRVLYKYTSKRLAVSFLMLTFAVIK